VLPELKSCSSLHDVLYLQHKHLWSTEYSFAHVHTKLHVCKHMHIHTWSFCGISAVEFATRFLYTNASSCFDTLKPPRPWYFKFSEWFCWRYNSSIKPPYWTLKILTLLSVLWDGWFWTLSSSSTAVDFPRQVLLKSIDSKFLFSVLL